MIVTKMMITENEKSKIGTYQGEGMEWEHHGENVFEKKHYLCCSCGE